MTSKGVILSSKSSWCNKNSIWEIINKPRDKRVI